MQVQQVYAHRHGSPSCRPPLTTHHSPLATRQPPIRPDGRLSLPTNSLCCVCVLCCVVRFMFVFCAGVCVRVSVGWGFGFGVGFWVGVLRFWWMVDGVGLIS